MNSSEKKEFAVFPALASVIAILMTGIYILLRYPFDMDYMVALKALSTSLFFINLPYCLYFFSKKDETYFYSYNIIVIIAILIAILIAGIFNLNILGYPIIFLGIVAFLITLFNYMRTIKFATIFHLFLLVIFCMWLSGVVWQGRNLTPLFLEKIIVGFYNTRDLNCGLDNFFHMSMAQMIKTYNIPSTGLDELPYIPYHYGGHFIFAQISQVLDISIIDIYHLGFPVIFLPLFFYLIFLVFHQFKELTNRTCRFDYFFWVLLFIVFIGILSIAPEGIAFRTGLAWNSIINSESYLLSMIFFLMLLSFIIVPVIKTGTLKITPIHFIFIISLLFFIGFTKISTLFMVDIILIYLYFRYKLYKSGLDLSGREVVPAMGNVNLYKVKFVIRPKSAFPTLLLVSLLTISAFLYYLLFDPMVTAEGSFSFLHFYKNFIHAPFTYFIILHFLWTFVLIVLWLSLYIHRVNVNTTLRAGLLRTKVNRFIFYLHKKNKYNPILLEIQIVLAIAGLLPGMFLNIAGGSAYYFSNIQQWTAMIFIAYYLSFSIQSLKKKGLRLFYASGFLLIVLASFNSVYSFTYLLKDNYIIKKCIMEKTNFDFDRMSIGLIPMRELISNHSLLYEKGLKSKLFENTDYNKLKFLLSLDKLDHKQSRILFIEDKEFFLQYFPCYKSPFLIASVTGMSLLDGFSLKNCFWGGWSIEVYHRDKRITKDQDLCAFLRNPIFKEVVSCNISEQNYKILKCGK